MSTGWISLYRSIQDNPLWTCESFTRGQAWVDLLLLANHKDSFFYKRNIKISVKRGQLARSEVELADRWHWSRTKVRKFINDLKKEQQIIQQKSNITQVLTIINYEKYQQKEQQGIQQEYSKSTARVQQEDTYNNNNNINNDNNDNNTRAVELGLDNSDPKGFYKASKLYPKPVNFNDANAKSSYFEQVANADGHDVIICAAEAYSEYIEASDMERRYIPTFENWLKKGEWQTDWKGEIKKINKKERFADFIAHWTLTEDASTNQVQMLEKYLSNAPERMTEEALYNFYEKQKLNNTYKNITDTIKRLLKTKGK